MFNIFLKYAINRNLNDLNYKIFLVNKKSFKNMPKLRAREIPILPKSLPVF